MENKQIDLLENRLEERIPPFFRYPCRCVFHVEQAGSLVLDLEDNSFHCFGCGADGKILELKAVLEVVEQESKGKHRGTKGIRP